MRDAIVIGREEGGPNAYVYFIRELPRGPIKIGYAGWSVLDRLNGLQVGNHRRLKLVGVFAGSEAEERRLHAAFAHLRLRGEWFRASPELMAFIKATSFDMRKVVLR